MSEEQMVESAAMARREADTSSSDVVDPDAIDPAFIPRARASVVSEPVGSEMVLVDSESGLVHALNPVAALVWQCFDGEASLDDLVADLADGFGAPADVVRDDLLTMTRAAGRSGLLDGVATRESGEPRITGLAEGEAVSLPPTPEEGAEARRTLLVNWSATCGFCIQILPELAALQPALDRAGTDIVLVDETDASATRSLIDERGLRARVLDGEVRSHGPTGPFAGMGTPVAYLLDRADRVASPLAYGAQFVLELARAAAGSPAGDSAPALELPRFLPVTGGVCGPAGPAAPIRHWAPTGAYSVGTYTVGIRAGSPTAERVLSEALADHCLPGGTSAPDNYSVVLAEDAPAGRRELSLLLAGSTVVARSRSPRRVMLALAGHLSSLLEPEPGLDRLDAIGGLVDGEAVLLPKAVMSWPERLQAPLAELGVAVVAEPFAHVDARSRELVVTGPRVRLNEEALDALADPPVGTSEPVPVQGGRYPLRYWLFPARDGRDGKLSPGVAAAAALGMLVGGPADVVNAMGRFIGLIDEVDALALPCDSPSALLKGLREWQGSRR